MNLSETVLCKKRAEEEALASLDLQDNGNSARRASRDWNLVLARGAGRVPRRMADVQFCKETAGILPVESDSRRPPAVGDHDSEGSHFKLRNSTRKKLASALGISPKTSTRKLQPELFNGLFNRW